MGNDAKTNEVRAPHVWEALISFFGLMLVMAVSIIHYEVDPHIPMFIGVIISVLVSLKIGWKWDDLEQFMVTGISQAMQSILILAIVGMMVGTWILSGTIPSMIYYGLTILKPSIFLVASVIICSITSLATGTSWGTAGTMGLALMGIAVGLDIPPAVAAGAILSGGYFGDKLSPLSDTTNLAPAMAGTDVFTHVKFMLQGTVISYIIALVFFGVYGAKTIGGGTADTSQVELIMAGIKDNFTINPLLMIPPLVVILSMAFKVPAIPGITLGLIVGAALVPVQGATFGDFLDVARNGFVCETGVEAVDSLLSNGGLMNMASSILMTVIAMMFGGIMEGTRQLEVVVNQVLKIVHHAAGLVVATEITCIISNAVMPEQYISILIPGRMYAPAYRKMGLHPKTLSNALESSGTVTSCLIPWNTCGMYMAATLGVAPFAKGAGFLAGYAPWAVFNWTMPIVTIILAVVGTNIAKMTPEEQKLSDAGELI